MNRKNSKDLNSEMKKTKTGAESPLCDDVEILTTETEVIEVESPLSDDTKYCIWSNSMMKLMYTNA